MQGKKLSQSSANFWIDEMELRGSVAANTKEQMQRIGILETIRVLCRNSAEH